jgi:hypothetical protein
MMTSDREGVIAWIRRLGPARERPMIDPDAPQSEQIRALEARLAHVEQLVEGLQDSVHREFERHARLIGEIQSQVQPAVLGAALAEDARNRGL